VICWGLSVLNYLKQHQDDVFLIGGQKNLVFYREIPNESKVLEFIGEVISVSKTLLKAKYVVIDCTMSEEEFLGRLNWLVEREIISISEKSNLMQDFKIKKLL
jgi:hypothetical protein